LTTRFISGNIHAGHSAPGRGTSKRKVPIMTSLHRLLAPTLLAALTASILIAAAPAQTNYQPAPENLKARQEFQDAKFGMFIHWGVYSVLGNGEWIFHDRKLTAHEYERLPKFFDPEKFDAKAWVALAKAAGMKYITITSRHHDGFAMFDSKVSDWNIVQRTPYGKDPLKMLADEAHRQGIKLFFYYSQLDWHNPDYFPRGKTAREWDNGRPDHGDWNAYLDGYMDGQLRELLTNYGAIGGIWFDGMWDKPDADWHLAKTYALIHQLQPAALIIPNHHETPRPGEDAKTPRGSIQTTSVTSCRSRAAILSMTPGASMWGTANTRAQRRSSEYWYAPPVTVQICC
jgi:alpha-L-fucosidase